MKEDSYESCQTDDGMPLVSTSGFLKNLINNRTEWGLLEIAFYSKNFEALCHFESLDALSPGVSAQLFKQSIRMGEYKAVNLLIDQFKFDGQEIMEFLNLTAQLSPDDVNLSLLDKLSDSDVTIFKDDYNDIIKAGIRKGVSLSPFFMRYPGEINNKEVVDIFIAHMQNLDVPFEKTISLCPAVGVSNFTLPGAADISFSHRGVKP